MLLILLALMRPDFAQTDFAEEAHARMKLSFDLDAAEAMIDAPLPQQARVAALPLTPNSEVEAVTVFRDRALVTRVLAQKLAAGPASLTFEGLPPGLDPGSLHL